VRTFLLVFLSTSALAQDPINLGLAPSYSAPAENTEQVTAEIQAAREVEIGGVRFVKIQNGAFALYVPKLDQYSTKDFDNAFCAGGSGPTSMGVPTPHSSYNAAGGSAPTPEFRELGHIEAKITNSLKVYVSLIADTIRFRCDGTDTNAQLTPPTPELGLSYQPDKNSPTKYKAFVQPKKAFGGVGVDF
jgi:hypothetical protein